MPFRDFTLTEFDTWRATLTLTLCKNTNFEGMTLGQNMQVVYYYLALSNYDRAFFFLNFGPCIETKDDHVAFLRILISQDRSDYHYVRFRASDFNEDFRKILPLCVKGYHPALLFINRLEDDFLFRDCSNISVESFMERLTKINPSATPTDVLNMLILIEKNMINSDVDEYYVKNAQTKINQIKSLIHQTNDMATNVDIISSSFPDFEFNNKSWEISIETIFLFALRGSDVALLQILRLDFKIAARILSKNKSDEYRFSMANNGGTINNIKAILINKINQLNIKIICALIENYRQVQQKDQKRMFLHSPHLINKCISRIYNYLLNGGDDFRTLEVYLNFFSDKNIEDGPRYYALCKNLVTLIISKGFLFLPFTNSYRRFEIIYKKFLNNEPLTKNSINTITDLVENCFCLKLFTDVVKIDELVATNDPNIKSKTFYFLLNLSSQLWEASMLVLGANFKDGILYDTFAFNDKLINSMLTRNENQYKEDCYNYVTSVICQRLSDTILKHNKIFQNNMCIDMSDFINKKGTDMSTTFDKLYVSNKLLMFQNICELVMPLIRDIIIHEKYKPGGVNYLMAKDDFNNHLLKMYLK